MNDMIRIREKGLRTEIDNLMRQLGYGNQPFFVYRHADIARVHFHLVSTRIDKQTGKKIKDNLKGRKSRRILRSWNKPTNIPFINSYIG